MRKSLAAVAALGALAFPSAVPAHDLTCSRSSFAHWHDLKRDKRLIADDKPRVECVRLGRNKVRIIGSARGSRFTIKQDVVKVEEKTYGPNTPFYYYVRYAISRPVLGTHG